MTISAPQFFRYYILKLPELYALEGISTKKKLGLIVGAVAIGVFTLGLGPLVCRLFQDRSFKILSPSNEENAVARTYSQAVSTGLVKVQADGKIENFANIFTPLLQEIASLDLYQQIQLSDVTCVGKKEEREKQLKEIFEGAKKIQPPPNPHLFVDLAEQLMKNDKKGAEEVIQYVLAKADALGVSQFHLFRIAEIKMRLGQEEEAKEIFKKALDIVREEPDPIDAGLYYAKSQVLYDQPQVMQLLEKAWQIEEQKGAEEKETAFFNSLAIVTCMARIDREKAKNLLQTLKNPSQNYPKKYLQHIAKEEASIDPKAALQTYQEILKKENISAWKHLIDVDPLMSCAKIAASIDPKIFEESLKKLFQLADQFIHIREKRNYLLEIAKIQALAKESDPKEAIQRALNVASKTEDVMEVLMVAVEIEKGKGPLEPESRQFFEQTFKDLHELFKKEFEGLSSIVAEQRQFAEEDLRFKFIGGLAELQMAVGFFEEGKETLAKALKEAVLHWKGAKSVYIGGPVFSNLWGSIESLALIDKEGAKEALIKILQIDGVMEGLSHGVRSNDDMIHRIFTLINNLVE